ncbi:hypothetical protein [Flavobacterium cerinum]|uniref:Uncharacterized protein n=1 Tax=Flavobacterium cerinum TaxID=2502784 RepID=A0A444H6L1_9FLAO|nr:hypothetical protein [Flavobacterium cerinum]RWW98815.1 hypothetical protein EPI11_12880 [Flavobacterium cerinum]
MKQYNIEEQLQRKLKERTITPSAEAWNRIAYNRQQQKKKKKRLTWYWTAAAIVIISLGGLLFVVLSNNDTIIIPQQTVVEQPSQPSVIEPAPESIMHQEFKREIILQDKKTNLNTTVAIEKQTSIRQEIKPLNIKPDSETVKANEVALAINELVLLKGSVTNDEVDSLLHKAQKEIAMERLKNKNLPTNDIALLNEAEKEMENSFRDKTLKIFNLKFKTIKIAIKEKH